MYQSGSQEEINYPNLRKVYLQIDYLQKCRRDIRKPQGTVQ